MSASRPSVWADIITPTTAKPIARYSQDYYANQAAATINAFGNGKVIYLGTLGGANFYNSITRWVLDLVDIHPLLETPTGVEVTERWQGEQRLLFVLNHTAVSQEVTLEDNYVDLISEKHISNTLTLKPFEVLILTG